MKHITRKVSVLLCLVFLLPCLWISVSADSATYYTYTKSATTGELEIVDDAFLPTGAFLELGLNAAQDMDVKNGMLYIADSGNKRILTVRLSDNATAQIGIDILNQPTGVAADDQGRIYVADYGNREAYRFSPEGELEQVFQKPDSLLYGDSTLFIPNKVAPDGNGGVYIVVDGATNGLVHMNAHGQFLGYFASNSVSKSLYAKLLEAIMTDEQIAKLTSYTPDSFGSVLYGTDGLVYTACIGKGKAIQKHSYSGTNLFASVSDMPVTNDITDIAMSPDGYLYILSLNGQITELTPDGHMLYRFGGSAENASRFGLTVSPSGLGVDEQHRVYVLDKGGNSVHVFSPTDMHAEITTAINAYQAGEYDLSREMLLKTVRYNSTSYFAHLYLGLSYMHDGDYRTAAEEFREAKAWNEYSDAFWDIRNDFLQKNLLGLLLAVAVVCALVLWIREKHPAEAYSPYNKVLPYRKPWEQYYPKNIKRTLLHPVDTAYLLRDKVVTGGFVGPISVIMLGYGVLTLWRLCSGPLFSAEIEDYPIAVNFAYYCAAFLLFIGCHYLVSSIMSGEASLSMITTVTSYALLPALLLLPVFTLLGNFATVNEAQLIITFEVVVGLFCLVLLFIMLKIVDGYSVGKLIGTLLITAFLMVLVIVFGSLLFLMCRQIFDFIQQVYMEVIIRG